MKKNNPDKKSNTNKEKRPELETVFSKEAQTVVVQIKRIVLIVCGAVLMAADINTFVNAGNLFPGGFTGLTILIQHIVKKYLSFDLPFTPVNLLLNIAPIIISFKFIGKKFTIYSCLMLVLSSILTDFIPGFKVTDDVLLAAVFGGLLNALSVYLCLLAGATSGGTDFISIFISERYGVDAWNYILIFNAAILFVAGFMFGYDRALYSILFQFTSTQMLNILYKRYQKVTLFVITNKADEVYRVIRDNTNHDATLFKGTGCYEGAERDMLYSVISGEESHSIAKKIKDTDPAAFINIVRSHGILGRFYMRPND